MISAGGRGGYMSECARAVVGIDEIDRRTDGATATDAELLIGCREGRPESWELLVRRYERLVYSVATRCGLRSADAADVVQMTFMALLRANEIRDSERVAAWLATVARRTSWQLLSKVSQEIPTEHLPEPEAGPLSSEDILVLHDALLRIDEPCRSLLIALYFDPDRPSYQQIADRLERSPGGIGPLRGRCLEQVRVLLSVEES
jgi:RNA polymerase sigma factor (sigma-70 family)